MASGLDLRGQINGMGGIKDAIVSIGLINATLSQIASTSVTGTSFSIDTSSGELSNSVAIDFDIITSIVGDTVTYARLYDSTGSQMTIELTTPVTLTEVGTKTFDIGGFKATL